MTLMSFRHATHREPCPVCNGQGEVPPVDLNPARPTLHVVTGEWLVCGSCLGLGVLYSTKQPEPIPA